MNKLCSKGKLYIYFSKEELASASAGMLELLAILKQMSFKNNKFTPEKVAGLEVYAMMLSLYDLEHALTKSEEVRVDALRLKSKTKKLFDQTLSDMSPMGRVDFSMLSSVFLTAYIYPLLLDKEEWKAWIDQILERINHNFKSMRQKITGDSQMPLDLELFGLANLAAIVLNRLDSEYYEKDINQILRSSVGEVLYKGMIGRPSSAYDICVDIEKDVLFNNKHMINNALFLEMLRECA